MPVEIYDKQLIRRVKGAKGLSLSLPWLVTNKSLVAAVQQLPYLQRQESGWGLNPVLSCKNNKYLESLFQLWVCSRKKKVSVSLSGFLGITNEVSTKFIEGTVHMLVMQHRGICWTSSFAQNSEQIWFPFLFSPYNIPLNFIQIYWVWTAQPGLPSSCESKSSALELLLNVSFFQQHLTHSFLLITVTHPYNVPKHSICFSQSHTVAAQWYSIALRSTSRNVYIYFLSVFLA